MTGALVQLVAYGAQDVYLTGKPQTTFWRERFARYSNFALESIQQDIIGKVDSDSTITVKLSRSGDLVYNLMIAITMQRGPAGALNPLPYYSCEQWINHLEMYIGGQKVMEFDHEWLRMYWELMYPLQQETAYVNMCQWANEAEGYYRTFYLQIPVWFNAMEPKNAIPLIALQYHEVEFKIRLCNLNDIVGINPDYIPDTRVWADYVFLDTEERKWYAQNPHEYIIQQVQTNRFPITIDTTMRKYNFYLTFNHPVKSLIWACTPGPTYHGQYTGLPGEQDDETLGPINDATLLLNGIERFASRRGSYFTTGNPWTTFSGSYTSAGVYAYGFGIHCDQNMPTGTCNFSRIDNTTLRLQTKRAILANRIDAGNVTENMTTESANILNTLLVFAPNFNILRIASGMGGLAYEN